MTSPAKKIRNAVVKQIKPPHSLTIVHLYPKEMNIYGDTGNVRVLYQRAKWREIDVHVWGIGIGQEIPSDTDILVSGGGQDAFQGEIQADLQEKAASIHKLVQHDVPMLVVCGTYQLFGRFFRTKTGARIQGIGVLPLETIAGKDRMIGNTCYEMPFGEVVGYENHSGQTFLDHPETTALGSAIVGDGNNRKDHFEGCRIRNVFGTYSHGPVLAKNPRFADELLRLALQRKYGTNFQLAPLDDTLENLAHEIAKTRPR